MSRSIRFCLSVLLGFLLVTLLILVCPRHAIAAPASNHFGRASAPATFFGGYAAPFFPSYEGYPGVYPYMPKYWWTGAYPEVDPRQEAYNPDAGYEWDSVEALILEVAPARARVVLNGTFIGTANYLGPIQLPLGRHTLRIEAGGYEPMERVLDAAHTGPEILEIQLKPMPQRTTSQVHQ
ncbi:MAG TPA: PEGA domain-containing protein [Terriglobia bacterium]|nr:PEGA domain-containing protein [Terriglobia bacterium]